MRLRISFLVLLLLAVIMLPWWLSLVLLLYFAWRVPFFYEAVMAGLVFDLLYGLPSTTGWWSLRFFAAIFTLLLVCLIETVKVNVRLA